MTPDQPMKDTVLDQGELFCLYFQGLNGRLQIDTTQNPWLFTFFNVDGTIENQVEHPISNLIDP